MSVASSSSTMPVRTATLWLPPPGRLPCPRRRRPSLGALRDRSGRAARWPCSRSGPFYALPAEELFEGAGGLAEQLRAAETRESSRGCQVRFQREEAVEAGGAQRGENLGPLPVPFTRRNDRVRAGEGILYVH